jgi:hypothetical protein
MTPDLDQTKSTLDTVHINIIPRVVHKNRQALETLLKAEQPQKEKRTQFFLTAFYVFYLQYHHHHHMGDPALCTPIAFANEGESHVRCNYM